MIKHAMVEKGIFALICTGLIALSFSLYGMVYYKGFNADMAIHVLMAEDFSIPRDLYYRDQDRLGSLIPMLAAPLIQIGVNSLWAVSLVPYILILGSFYFLQGFFKYTWQKGCLLVLLLFPNWTFVEQILPGHPYISQLFFLSAFLWVYFKSSVSASFKYAILALLAAAMVWASEMALVNLLAFFLIYHKNILNELKHPKVLLSALSSGFIAVLALILIKIKADKTVDFYNFLATKAEILQALRQIVFEDISGLVLFEENKIFAAFLFWCLLIALVVFLIYRKPIEKLTQFLLVSALGSAVMIILSHWSALNFFPLRYYTLAYLQLILAMLVHTNNFKNNIWIYINSGLICFLTAYRGYYVLQNYSLEVNERLNREEILTLTAKGKFGVIGSYWNSYTLDATSENVVATPHENAYVRMPERVELVFEMDSIMIIKNEVYIKLPDTTSQFERTLYRISEVQELNEFQYAFFKVMPFK